MEFSPSFFGKFWAKALLVATYFKQNRKQSKLHFALKPDHKQKRHRKYCDAFWFTWDSGRIYLKIRVNLRKNADIPQEIFA
ncbi:MAG: hypothetical protein COB78_03720 [Hyphomicrobiales bacterium]|nr:MAG: hypothetical protein COB78_03720 [Hyphomicrobiales bacterium]